METASSSDIPIIPDNVEDVVMNVDPDMSQGLTPSTSNSSNSPHYSCSEEPSITQQILSALRSLPYYYKERSIFRLTLVLSVCKIYYNAHATANGKTLSSWPGNDQSMALLQRLGQDTRNELHDLVDQDKFAALFYHGTSFISVLTRKPDLFDL